MTKYEYFWVTLHHYEHGNKELQSEDFFYLMSQISKHLYDGWVVTYFKLMNRGD